MEVLKPILNLVAQIFANFFSKTPKLPLLISKAGAVLTTISGIVLLLHDNPYLPETAKSVFDTFTFWISATMFLVARMAVYITPEDEAKQ